MQPEVWPPVASQQAVLPAQLASTCRLCRWCPRTNHRRLFRPRVEWRQVVSLLAGSPAVALLEAVWLAELQLAASQQAEWQLVHFQTTVRLSSQRAAVLIRSWLAELPGLHWLAVAAPEFLRPAERPSAGPRSSGRSVAPSSNQTGHSEHFRSSAASPPQELQPPDQPLSHEPQLLQPDSYTTVSQPQPLQPPS